MTVTRLRKMALSFTDAVLEVTASRGLVRRAQADVADGKVVVEQEDESSAKLRVEDATVRMDMGGIAGSICDCPAPGICRHRLAAIIYLRQASAPAETSVSPVMLDWRTVFEGIPLAAIARFAGKTSWHELASLREYEAQVDPRDDGYVVTIGTERHRVVFMPEGGLPAAMCKAPSRNRKFLIAKAALAARNAFGLPQPSVDDTLDADQTPMAPRVPALGEIRDFIARVYATGFSTAPVALEEEARRHALTGRVEALPRLAALLRQIASELAAVRRRDATADAEILLARLATAYALCTAFMDTTDQTLLRRLSGQVRQDYEPIAELRLIGLGARVWENGNGPHGVTTHLVEADTGRLYSVSHARPDRNDPQFHPRTAFHQTPVWGQPMSKLCGSRVRLLNAQVSNEGRLSMSAQSRATTETWLPVRDEVRNWPIAFDDWVLLERRVQLDITPRLVSTRSELVVLLFSRSAPASFDEITQTLTWPVADSRGRWIGLTLNYEGSERQRIEALEDVLGRKHFWGVVALVEEAGGGIDLHPFALWGEKTVLLDFATEGRRDADRMSLLDRLRRFARTQQSGPTTVSRLGGASDRLLDQAWQTLLRRAEGAQILDRGRATAELGDLTTQLGLAGYGSLSRMMARLQNAPESADQALSSAYCLSVARAARARLAWMA